MKSLRVLVLMMAVTALPVLQMQAYGQQEVDPDHFDQSAATASAGKAHKQKVSSPSHHPHHAHVNMASKHLGNKAHHHSSRAAA